MATTTIGFAISDEDRPLLDRAAELCGRGWLNTGGRPLSIKDRRGKIVLLDF